MARILLVEDDPQVREFLRFSLADFGHEVVALADGRSAADHASQHVPDLVITDLFMPGKDGFETILALRAQNPQLRVLAISGGSQRLAVGTRLPLELARDLGAAEVLGKPFSRARLREVVDQLLSETRGSSDAGT